MTESRTLGIRGLSNARWIFYKEILSFFGTNVLPVAFGVMALLCGLVSVLIAATESVTYEDVTRSIFYLFYIIIIASSLFLSVSSFVNEKRQNTMELLRTLPVTETEIVLGKFLPGFFYVTIISTGMTLVYIVGIAEAPWYLVAAGLPGLILAGLYAYGAGMLASSFADSYLTGLLIATGILTAIDVGGFLSGLLPSPAREILSHMHSVNQYLPFTRGVIPLRGTVYFLSMILMFLFLTVRSLQSRRWSGNDE